MVQWLRLSAPNAEQLAGPLVKKLDSTSHS